MFAVAAYKQSTLQMFLISTAPGQTVTQRRFLLREPIHTVHLQLPNCLLYSAANEGSKAVAFSQCSDQGRADCVRFTPGDFENGCDRDKLSAPIHQPRNSVYL